MEGWENGDLCVGLKQSEFLDHLADMREHFVEGAVVVGLMAVLISLLFMRRRMRPLGAITQAVHRLRENDLDVDVPAQDRQDEIGTQIAGIQSATREAVAAIETITRTIAKINEVNATVASAVEGQGAAAQEIARNVEQAAADTQEVSSNISGVSAAANETGTAAGPPPARQRNPGKHRMESR